MKRNMVEIKSSTKELLAECVSLANIQNPHIRQTQNDSIREALTLLKDRFKQQGLEIVRFNGEGE